MPSFHESSTKYEGINNNSQVRKHLYRTNRLLRYVRVANRYPFLCQTLPAFLRFCQLYVGLTVSSHRNGSAILYHKEEISHFRNILAHKHIYIYTYYKFHSQHSFLNPDFSPKITTPNQCRSPPPPLFSSLSCLSFYNASDNPPTTFPSILKP